jgi:hypothetical protein
VPSDDFRTLLHGTSFDMPGWVLKRLGHVPDCCTRLRHSPLPIPLFLDGPVQKKVGRIDGLSLEFTGRVLATGVIDIPEAAPPWAADLLAGREQPIGLDIRDESAHDIAVRRWTMRSPVMGTVEHHKVFTDWSIAAAHLQDTATWPIAGSIQLATPVDEEIAA